MTLGAEASALHLLIINACELQRLHFMENQVVLAMLILVLSGFSAVRCLGTLHLRRSKLSWCGAYWDMG